MPTDRETAEAAKGEAVFTSVFRNFIMHFNPERVLALLDVVDAIRNTGYVGEPVREALEALEGLDVKEQT